MMIMCAYICESLTSNKENDLTCFKNVKKYTSMKICYDDDCKDAHITSVFSSFRVRKISHDDGKDENCIRRCFLVG